MWHATARNSKFCSEWASFMFSKPSVRKAIAVGTVLLALPQACSHGNAAHTEVSDTAQATQAPDARCAGARCGTHAYVAAQ